MFLFSPLAELFLEALVQVEPAETDEERDEIGEEAARPRRQSVSVHYFHDPAANAFWTRSISAPRALIIAD